MTTETLYLIANSVKQLLLYFIYIENSTLPGHMMYSPSVWALLSHSISIIISKRQAYACMLSAHMRI